MKLFSFAKPSFCYQDFVGQIDRFETNYAQDIDGDTYFGFPLGPILDIESKLKSATAGNIAYFSMEFGLAPGIYNSLQLKKKLKEENKFFSHEVFSNDWLCDYLFKVYIDKMLDIPIYSGGLGVLAGDTIKSCADKGFPVAAVGILWNKGYFKQKFWYKHGQIPDELKWDPETYPGLIPLRNTVVIETRQGPLHLRLWKYYVYSYHKKTVCPLILLDSNLPQNSASFRRLTDQLYRSDDVWWKIFQRAILGIGGMKALDSLGYQISRYHLNEGHAAFALAQRYVDLDDKSAMEHERNNFAYTCHTPVAAGHDRFRMEDVSRILTDEYLEAIDRFGKEFPGSDQVNLTFLCLNNCPGVNAVAQKHGEITRLQFPHFASKVQAITNGVHLHTWLSGSFQQLFDKHTATLGDWRQHPQNLRNVAGLRNDKQFREDIFEAHQQNKRNLMKTVRRWKLDENVLTVGWARRIAGYKRPALIFHKIERILKLAKEVGPIQIVMAGKAHPNDDIGSAHIDEILDHIDQLNDYNKVVKVLILENYDTFFGKLLTNSVDVWLNNPLPPFEASGTSGMKAILNGVLQLSTLDGWVVEAADKDIGWIFGYQHSGPEIGNERDLRLDQDSDALYNTLEEILKLYYATNRSGVVDPKTVWVDKMINCVAQAGFFNTQRMVEEYKEKMWKS